MAVHDCALTALAACKHTFRRRRRMGHGSGCLCRARAPSVRAPSQVKTGACVATKGSRRSARRQAALGCRADCHFVITGLFVGVLAASLREGCRIGVQASSLGTVGPARRGIDARCIPGRCADAHSPDSVQRRLRPGVER